MKLLRTTPFTYLFSLFSEMGNQRLSLKNISLG